MGNIFRRQEWSIPDEVYQELLWDIRDQLRDSLPDPDLIWQMAEDLQGPASFMTKSLDQVSLSDQVLCFGGMV